MKPAPRRCPAFCLSVLAVLWFGLTINAPAQGGRLADATSPYLTSHADDAIDWYPWGMAALERARRENKPIYLSIGYASCYWCHVLSRTTWADKRVIGILNEHFVNILVDRDERPDLDGYFMKIMLAMVGQSGSPANFFLTADLVPLFAAGYIAPDREYSKPGFVKIARTLVREWTGNREGVLKEANIIRDQLRVLAKPHPTGAAKGREDPRESAARAWSGSFDETHGGFGGGAKFLFPNVLSFLLHRGVWRRDAALLENVYRTLDHMAAGGVRDQLGGAFHRYAVDRFWQMPHFEIMLADNALLARLYLEAYQASGRPRYAAVARAILDDLLDRLWLPGGGFASALDAETEGKEGLFYTWTAAEVRSVLGARKAAPFIAAYVDPSHGLVRGRSVLRLLDAPQSLLEIQARLADSRARLLKARAKRAAPLRDDKILASWNALAVSAFAKAARVLNETRYLDIAQAGMRALLGAFAAGHGLSHSRRGGKAAGAVFLDDYAFLVQALLDLYETDFKPSRLDDARAFMKTVIERFREKPGMAFRFTPLDQPSDIPARTILEEDGMPSGNAAALISLHRLVLFGAEAAFEDESRAILRGLGRYLESSAASATGLLLALDFRPDEAHEIVIVGNLDDGDTRRLLAEAYRRLLHGTVLVVIDPDAAKVNDKWPLLAGRPMLGGKATAYVCRKRLCDFPVATPGELSAQLDKLVSDASAP
ncbi:MAG: thioredoxin domain-containing protein [Proteobacteria bacterium]|nr:thioredoxin domain-containing protein [Pseudomonadota bacterium]